MKRETTLAILLTLLVLSMLAFAFSVQLVNSTAKPHADFTWSPTYPLIYETVTFDASASYDPDGTIVSYKWEFGDGNVTIVSYVTIIHTYTSGGTYTVTLNVTDSEGEWDTVSKNLTISVRSTRYPWPMFRHNLRHTGYTESPAPRTNQTQWNYTTGDYVYFPAVADGKVYVGSCDHKVYCLDALTGALIWNYTTGNYVASCPAVADGRVYVGSYDKNVYCLNASTGALIWNYTTGGIVWSSPAVADGRLYIGSWDSKVYCLNASTGTFIWSYTTGNWVDSSPAVVDGRVYVGSRDFRVYCLNASTGTRIWNYTTGDLVLSSPAVVDSKIYVGSYDSKVYCLNALTGAHIWNYTTGNYVASSPAVADGKVYVGSCDNKVYSLDASTGALVWNYTTGNYVTSSPAVADGKVYIGSYDTKVYCLNASSGARIWSYKTGDWVHSSPAVADGVVYAGSDDGVVYAFGNVIRVPEDYSTVTEAIKVATSGATISIAPGIYNESVIINKPLTIIGRKGSDPTFTGSGSGIAWIIQSGGSGSTIAGLVITYYAQGIFIDGASNCKIYDNIMTRMVNSGIVEANNAANNFIYNNIFQDNGYGAVAINLTEYSTGNKIYNNTMILNSVGLYIKSSDNTIYWNIFIDNTDHVHVEGSLHNAWDNGYPDGGNFWSTYSGEDLYRGPYQNETGSDGIIDVNYTIAVDNVDRYPLVKPFSPHDIGIIEVITSKTIIAQGSTLHIHVNIVNYGIHDEVFTVTVSVNAVFMATQAIALTSRNSTTVTFSWSTTGVAKGNYIISAMIDTLTDEIDTTDNSVPDSPVFVTILGDVTGDRVVDGQDVIIIIEAIPSYPGHPKWNPNCDLNDDNVVDGQDITLAIEHIPSYW